MTVDHLDPTPLGAQIAAILRTQIRSGELQPRAKLPSEADLERDYGVSRGPARDAMEILRSEGYARTVRGRGSFVAPREEWPD